MFWTPSKTIYTGPRKQRGNITVGLGFPPTRLVDVNGDYVDTGLPSGGGGWSLVKQWDTDLGDMAAIDAAFLASGGPVRDNTLAWSPDGTKLTLSSSSSDDTKVFLCGTAFEPNSASQIFSFAVTNPSWGHYNRAGNRFVDNVIVGDVYQMYTASGFVINNGTPIVDNEVSKADVGFNASSDAPAVFGPDFTYMLWLGRNNTTGDAFRDISTPFARLDDFVVAQDGNQALDINGNPTSNLDLDETGFIRGVGSQGFQFYTMDSPREVDSLVEGTPQPVNGFTDHRPSAVWFDPNDTEFVWSVWDSGGRYRMAKFATNVPSN